MHSNNDDCFKLGGDPCMSWCTIAFSNSLLLYNHARFRHVHELPDSSSDVLSDIFLEVIATSD